MLGKGLIVFFSNFPEMRNWANNINMTRTKGDGKTNIENLASLIGKIQRRILTAGQQD